MPRWDKALLINLFRLSLNCLESSARLRAVFNDRLVTSLIKVVDLLVQNELFEDEGLREAHVPVEFLS